MRLYEITQPDPILSDARMVEVIRHYMGQSTVELIQVNSPYTATSAYKQYKGIYDRIAQAVRPLVQVENPNMDLIVQTVNKQLPIISLPKEVQAKIAQRQQLDRKQDLAHKNHKPVDDIKTDNGWVIPDEPPPPAWKLPAK